MDSMYVKENLVIAKSGQKIKAAMRTAEEIDTRASYPRRAGGSFDDLPYIRAREGSCQSFRLLPRRLHC